MLDRDRSGDVFVNQVRVLIAVEPPLLREALMTLLDQQPGFGVVDETNDRVAILLKARKERVDVVIATFKSTRGVPALVTHIMAEFPHILIVGIFLDEQRACVYRNRIDVRPITDYSAAGIVKALLGRLRK